MTKIIHNIGSIIRNGENADELIKDTLITIELIALVNTGLIISWVSRKIFLSEPSYIFDYFLICGIILLTTLFLLSVFSLTALICFTIHKK